jgi:hypothetical protein
MVDSTQRSANGSEPNSRKQSSAQKSDKAGDPGSASRNQKTTPQRKSVSAEATPSSSAKKRRKVNHGKL